MKYKRKYLNLFLIFCFFLVLLASRRWQQIISPQVWDEDGAPTTSCGSNAPYLGGSNLAGYINDGWQSFFEPVNGYLILVPKIISGISLYAGILNYPLTSTILAWCFTGLVGLAIYISPTRLKGRLFCAVSVFLIPSNPEVFGLPLYTLWWSALLLLLLTVWDETRANIACRLSFLVLGGFSSPIIVLVLPALYLRAWIFKALKSERIIALLATIIAAVQVSFIIGSGSGEAPKLSGILKVIPVFPGNFLLGNLLGSSGILWLAGMTISLILARYLHKNRTDYSAWILVYLLIGSIAFQIFRVDPALLNPGFAGPRYFFYPFILLFWILIQSIFTSESRGYRFLLDSILAAALVNSIPVWSRQHDDLHWKAHVVSCSLFPDEMTYSIPVHFDGNKDSAWPLVLKAGICKRLIHGGGSLGVRTYPYAKREFISKNMPAPDAVLVDSTMKGADFERSEFEGFRVVGSFVTSDADVGEVTLRLRRGSKLLYRSGPGKYGQSISVLGHEEEFSDELPVSVNWTVLDFSNSKLPSEFSIKIKDHGTQFGEWSAVAVRK